MNYKKNFLFALLFCAMPFLGALEVSAKLNKPSGIYNCGENIIITVVVTDNGKPVSGKKVKYHIEADGGLNKKGSFVSDAGKPFTFTHKLAKPGMLRSSFILLDDKGKTIPIKRKINQKNCVSDYIGALSEPEKIKPAVQMPADFYSFWADQRKALDAVPMKELERKKIKNIQGVTVYDIKVSCLGKPVSGYLFIPDSIKNGGKRPVILSLHGAGVASCMLNAAGMRYARQGFVVFDINAHGIPNGMSKQYYANLAKGELYLYFIKCYETREAHYARGMILRIMRALEYVKTLPQWNGKDLIAYGNSQGGYQSIIAAGLDKQVTLCRAGVPAFADFEGEFYGDFKRIPRIHLAQQLRKKDQVKKGEAFRKKVLKAYSYMDPVNFARTIKCPVYVSAGACDLSSPASAVYSIFNSIPAGVKKSIVFYPAGLHATSNKIPAFEAVMDKLIKAEIK